jgi:hypothetical protein
MPRRRGLPPERPQPRKRLLSRSGRVRANRRGTHQVGRTMIKAQLTVNDERMMPILYAGLVL